MKHSPLAKFSPKRLAALGGRPWSTFTAPRKALNPGEGLARVGRRAKAKRSARAECCDVVRRRSDGLCQAGPLIGDIRCAIAGEHVHEVRSRAQGGSITDPGNCLYVCHHCHNWIHHHPQRSAELGLLYSKKHSFNRESGGQMTNRFLLTEGFNEPPHTPFPPKEIFVNAWKRLIVACRLSQSTWRRLTNGERCPACGGTVYCTVTNDGLFCRCMRLESHSPVKAGGWIHRIVGNRVSETEAVAPPPSTPTPVSPPEVDRMNGRDIVHLVREIVALLPDPNCKAKPVKVIEKRRPRSDASSIPLPGMKCFELQESCPRFVDGEGASRTVLSTGNLRFNPDGRDPQLCHPTIRGVRNFGRRRKADE